MVDHLIANYDVTGEEAYMLCSLAGDLKIAEVVDVPHMLVTMHFPKSILSQLKKTLNFWSRFHMVQNKRKE